MQISAMGFWMRRAVLSTGAKAQSPSVQGADSHPRPTRGQGQPDSSVLAAFMCEQSLHVLDFRGGIPISGSGQEWQFFAIGKKSQGPGVPGVDRTHLRGCQDQLILSVLVDFVWEQSLEVLNFGGEIKILAVGSWMRMRVPLHRKERTQRRGKPREVRFGGLGLHLCKD